MHQDRHIEQILNDYDYDHRSVRNPDACPCYTAHGKCHDMDTLNCFLCYCPYYRTDVPEGGCVRHSDAGKWCVSDTLPAGKIWDCSDCTYPHDPAMVRQFLKRMFESPDE